MWSMFIVAATLVRETRCRGGKSRWLLKSRRFATKSRRRSTPYPLQFAARVNGEDIDAKSVADRTATAADDVTGG